MRLGPIPMTSMTSDQASLFAQMQKEIPQTFSAFKVYNSEGEFLGPWNAWLHQPEFGSPIWALSNAVCAKSHLSDRICQIVILSVGAKYKAAYELYAHTAVATVDCFSKDELDCLIHSVKPEGLDQDEGLAFDIALSLLDGGVLQKHFYDAGISRFGNRDLAQLVYLVGFYCLVSVTLNAYAIPAP